jgi:hypothetical protein
MKFLCLCAVFNHSQEWAENAIHCFQQQTHPDRTLLILDDRPPEYRWPNVREYTENLDSNVLYAVVPNFGNMAKKYNYGLQFAKDNGIGYSGVTIYDDDDHFLPDHLERHAAVLENNAWSMPEAILSLYGPSVIRIAPSFLYWSSYAFRREITDKHGFGDYGGLGYDQEFVKLCRREYGEPGIMTGSPTYLYNFSGIPHLSVTGKSYDDTSWVKNVIPVAATGPLKPKPHPLMTMALGMAKDWL